MKRLLIADSSEPLTASLSDSLAGDFHIRVCSDGETALEELAEFRPDVLVLNLQLPYKDGLTVLQETAFRPPVILATTSYMSPYVERAAAQLGVGYTMISPAVSALRVRLMDMVKTVPGAESRDLVAETATHLHILNFLTHLDGYRQLCQGIPLFCQDPQQRLTKELYPEIARICGCRDSRSVEHSIRKAIEAAWKARDPRVWAKYFPPGSSGSVPCPTNKEFISRLSKML